MSKSVLIVEKDLALMKELREELQGRGYEVDETTDGKGAPELIRRKRPTCIVLAVDLDAGQNGYIICKKLKSDADLKSVPIIIIGDPKGFGQHQRLKTRAEDYLSKPLAAFALADGVRNLVGFPELPNVEESFDPLPLLEEELSVAVGTALDDGSDPELAMIDSIFEEKSAKLPSSKMSSALASPNLPRRRWWVSWLLPRCRPAPIRLRQLTPARCAPK